jgi:hypothetical protein
MSQRMSWLYDTPEQEESDVIEQRKNSNKRVVEPIIRRSNKITKEPDVMEGPDTKEPCNWCYSFVANLEEHLELSQKCVDRKKHADERIEKQSRICKACDREYSNVGNLNKHLKSNVICQKWIDSNNIFSVRGRVVDNNTIGIIQNNYESAINFKQFQDGDHGCKACGKKFTTHANINRHLKNSIVCQKWIDSKQNPVSSDKLHFDVYPKADSNELVDSLDEHYKYNEDMTVNTDTKTSIKFEAPKDNLIHVIWNLYLCDKYQTIDQELIINNNIGYIIAILPTKEDYQKYIDPQLCKHHVIEYFDNHEDIISDDLIKTYENQCGIMEDVRLNGTASMKMSGYGNKNHRNIVIFCNSGFQRAIPFICYYLLKHHPDEFHSLIAVLHLVLGKMQNKHQPDLVEEYTVLLPRLCNLFNKAK